jgi:hypothetical protein
MVFTSPLLLPLAIDGTIAKYKIARQNRSGTKYKIGYVKTSENLSNP